MEEIVKSPELLLIAAGIAAFIVAVTKGGFTIKGLVIPELSARQCTYICVLGSVLLVSGVGLAFTGDQDQEQVPEETEPVPPSDDNKPEKRTDPEKTAVEVRGKLIDYFHRPMEGRTVCLDCNDVSKKYITNSDGAFKFSELQDGVSACLVYEAVRLPFTTDRSCSNSMLLKYNPVRKESSYQLCKSVVDRVPNAVFSGENPQIALDSLLRNDGVPQISCFCRLYGAYEYAKHINANFEYRWISPSGSVTVWKQRARFSESGWRTEAKKTIGERGQWSLEIVTDAGEHIETIDFEII